jgi:hypothetical protein
MTDLQTEVATAADRAGAHATAPALLLQAQAALGRLAETANTATESGRLPFRVGLGWDDQLGDLAHTIFLLADQTGINLEDAVRRASSRVQLATYARPSEDPYPGGDWS